MNFQQFQEEFSRLKLRYPVAPNHSARSENAEYGDYVWSCKNIYFSFDVAHSNDIVYIFDSFKAVNSYDGDYIIQSQNCYECVDVVDSTNLFYCNYCARLFDSYFCWDCQDSNNLFGCTHLKNQQYCIFNRRYTEAEYKKKVQELLKRPYEENLAEMKHVASRFPVTQTLIYHSENCDYGNHLDYSKNLYLSFDCAYSQDGAYLSDAHHNKNCFDLTQSFHSEFCYDCVDCMKLNNCYYMVGCDNMYDSSFCHNCANSNHLFGCASLDKNEYCIFNKKYTKEEYEKQVKEIMDSFRATAAG